MDEAPDDTVAQSSWSAHDGRRLAAARAQKADLQSDLASWVEQRGLGRPAQSTISRWEGGGSPDRPDVLAALREYSADIELERPDLADIGGTRRLSATNRRGFDEVIADLTGERALSDRQARFIDGVIGRLATGPPLSPDDGEAVRDLRRVLGLE